jgi:two-component sensor histidine kinase
LDPRSPRRWTLPPTPASAKDVRRVVGRACGGLAHDTTKAAELLATELFSNAVRHGSGEILLVVGRDGPHLRVEVHDDSPDLPRVVEADLVAEGGMGLRLIRAMATEWGVDERVGRPGKCVWFSVD